MDDDTPWLDGEEMRIWRGFLEATARVSSALADSLKNEADLTLDDYEVLVHLSESDSHRLRMTELSNRVLHSQSRLTQRVDRLAERNLVSREKCPEDGRGKLACLTPEGLRTIQALAPTHVRDVRRVLIDLIEPAERPVIAAVFERVIANACTAPSEKPATAAPGACAAPDPAADRDRP